MKRSKPLQRKTPLKSSGKGLKKAPLNKVSKTQAKRLREYAKAKQEKWGGQDVVLCERCGAQANDCHHAAGRGKNIAVHLHALCRPCHEAVHSSPNQARLEGYIID